MKNPIEKVPELEKFFYGLYSKKKAPVLLESLRRPGATVSSLFLSLFFASLSNRNSLCGIVVVLPFPSGCRLILKMSAGGLFRQLYKSARR